MSNSWSESQVKRSQEMLRATPRNRYAETLLMIGEDIGRTVTPDSIKAAFLHRGLGPPTSYCGPPSWGAVDTTPPPAERAPSPPTERRDGLCPQLSALVGVIKKGPLSFEQLCDALDVSPSKLRALMAEAEKHHVDVQVDGDHVGQRPRAASDEMRAIVMPVSTRQCFAVASDIHIGSKHFLREQLEDFVDRAYARGVRTILHPGDLLDGVYKHSVWEQSERGFAEQSRAAAEQLPRRPGLNWEFILGNHDETFSRESGLDVGHAIVDVFKRHGRNDLRFHGERGAYLRLAAPGQRRGLIVELWHPLGGGAYSVSYKLQNHIRDYAVGAKPDCVFAGHWHQQCYLASRGVHAFLSGTFQGGKSAFGKALGGSPSIGGWIVDYALTEDGTVRELSPTWVAYYENEAPRGVEMAA